MPIKIDKSRIQGIYQIPQPVNVSLIPHCILVKYRIPRIPFQTLVIVLPAAEQGNHKVFTKSPAWRVFNYVTTTN